MIRKENVDRRLLILAITAFFFETALFMGDVGLLPWRWLSRTSSGIEQSAIGEVQIARQNVRRRGSDSNIWEDSLAKDSLFENDSILTLSGSTAKLKLQGNINIELHENTLVVLEPMDVEADKPFRLRFSRGDLRAQNPGRGVQLKSGDWAITASPGADLSLRAVDSGRVEVEVTSGKVDVRHSIHGLQRQITSEQRMTLFPEEAGEIITTSQILKWQHPGERKIYAHKFPVMAEFNWLGSARRLEILSPTQGKKTLTLSPNQSSSRFEFLPGSYHLTLHDKDRISRTLSVQVLKAPKLTHLTPLPRDRIKSDQVTLFTWLSEMLDGKYVLEFARDEQFSKVVYSAKSGEPRVRTAVPVVGSLFWRITGFDEENFLIPAAYSYPLLTHPDPLDAPKLRAPTAIETENEDGASLAPTRSTLFAWRMLWSLLLPDAEGQTLRRSVAKPAAKVMRPLVTSSPAAAKKEAKKPAKKYVPPVIFNWEALPGADHYIIEISSSINFENPEVIAKLSTNFYAWTNFNKQIYYYRVAGGAMSGRVGVFSAPEQIDLTNWPPPNVAKRNLPKTPTRTVVKITTESPAAKAKPPEIVLPAPEGADEVAAAATAEDASRGTPPPAENSPPPSDEVTEPMRNDGLANPWRDEDDIRADDKLPDESSNRKSLKNRHPSAEANFSKGSIWWRPFYQVEKQESPGGVRGEFQGGSFLGLGVNLDFDLNPSRFLVFGDWQSVDWQPRRKTKWPFQKKMSAMTWHLNFAFADATSRLYYGGSVQQVARVHRASFERVEVQGHTGFGPLIGWRSADDGVRRRHELSVIFANGFTQVGLNNLAQVQLDSGFFAGTEINFAAGFGSYESSSVLLGLHGGYSW